MKTFFLAIKHEQTEKMLKLIQPYVEPLEKYIISKETSSQSHQATNGEHFHFFFKNMTTNKYNQLMVKVKDVFNLNGKATAEVGRQYGAVKKIKNEELMKAYIIKDITSFCAPYSFNTKTLPLVVGNVQKCGYSTNYSKEEIVQLHELSFKKKKTKWQFYLEDINNYIENNWPGNKDLFLGDNKYSTLGNNTVYYTTSSYIIKTDDNMQLLKTIVKIYYQDYNKIITKNGMIKTLYDLGLITTEYLVENMKIII